MQHTFWYISLLLLCAITTWNFQKLPSYTFYGGTVVCVPVPFFSLPLTFTLVAASTSHFLTAAINFYVILPTNLNWSPFNNLFFIFCPSSFFVIYINVDIKIKLKERISFVVVFLPLKAWVATQFIAKTSGTWNAKFYPSFHEGVDVRTDVETIFSELKFAGCIDNQIFLPMVLHCVRCTQALL